MKSRETNRGVCNGGSVMGGRFLILGLLLAAASGIADAQSGAEVRNVRFGVDDDTTRIVIETATEIDFNAFTLADPAARLVLEMPQSAWNVAGLSTGEGRGHGLVNTFRFFDASAASSRLVFELSHTAVVDQQFPLPPETEGGNYRLVIDVRSVGQTEVTQVDGFPEPEGLAALISTRADATYAPPERERRVIVLDAGHGGRDPGATGISGTREATVTLEAALELRRQLEATGRYEIIMTRSDDSYPSLEERVRIASAAHADLFISLHADSAGPNSTARGASVYTLSDHGAGRARTRTLQSTDWILEDETPRREEVNNILVSLALREKRNQSTVFAEMLLPRLAEAGPVVTNAHRQRGLYVLLDSQIPAVLVEMGFLTNREDEANLLSPAYRRNLMTQITETVDAYFSRLDPAPRTPERMAELSRAP
tara:strand:+ start:822 stop:2102 length:1281 start_codon:yes stop_codon:yes gene_type:complete